MVTIYDVGDTVNAAVQVVDTSGALADATVAVLLTAPDGTTSTPSINHPSTGNYNTNVVAAMPGDYLVHFTFSGAVVGTEDVQFYAQPAGTRILGLSETKAHLNIPATSVANDNELRGFIDAAGEICEAVCGPILTRTVVEYHDGGSGRIFLRKWPTLSVTTVVETWWAGANFTLTQEADLGVGPSTGYDYTFDRERGFIERRRAFMACSFMPGSNNIKITYLAGRSQPWPANIRLGALELVSWFWRVSQQGKGFPRATVGGSQTTIISGYVVPNAIVDTLLGHDRLPPMGGTGTA